MKFVVAPETFAKLLEMYVGVVVAQGINNAISYDAITTMLKQNNEQAQVKYRDVNVREQPEIIPYWEAFWALGINPNRFPCSVEALFKRIAKGHKIPSINPLVDLNNALSLKYALPMGTHTLDGVAEPVTMRLAQAKDQFIPLGTDHAEELPAGEVVYAVGSQVRTRRWTWRQSEHGKITATTQDVFFPIDGFADINKDRVEQARMELQEQLETIFGVKTQTGVVDRKHPEFEWE